ncbi:hypothetical protein HMPREF9441_01826 [Paraprevotella clara YIT 11840]|uniref:Uncharacterized protein n=1 Tax=Paraprevotella clara YIT 11840 TaxID=762968 RepID=G5SR36_9BACT|nr:hypothetical protein HMPREF9441_01826 [Paraprevotella clara YIT 11840]
MGGVFKASPNFLITVSIWAMRYVVGNRGWKHETYDCLKER